MAAITKAPQAMLHAGGWHEMTPDGQQLTCTHLPSGHDADDPSTVLRDSAIAYAPWHPAAAIVKRDAVHGECLWDESMNRKVTEDTVFWWRLIARHRVSVHPHCGVRYRRGTPGCRDQFRDPVKWSQGLFHALDSNVRDWRSLGHPLRSAQVANLVRVYESFGMEGMQSGEIGIANEAFYRADQLLAHGIWESRSAIARRLLGTRRFQRLRSLACGLKSVLESADKR
jgi:hypothetical protein